MMRNVGKWDRAIRTLLGMYMVRNYRHKSDIKSWRSALGSFWLMTAAFGYCPIYQMFGVNTRRGHSSNLHVPHMPNVGRLAFWR